MPQIKPMKEWIAKYEEHFGEQFPLSFLPEDVEPKLVVAIIMYCLENDTEYDPREQSIL
mgnify:CR=1 FL=1